MKEGITGYITALVNNHNNALNMIPVTNIQARDLHTKTIQELGDLLYFIADMSESKKLYITTTFKENADLRRRVNELEASCENDSGVIKNLQKQIAELKESNFMWQNACNTLRENNEVLEEKLKQNGGNING